MSTEATVDKLTKLMDNDSMSEQAEAVVDSVESLVPEKDALITMSPDQLQTLVAKVQAETAALMADSPDFINKVRLQLEQNSALRTIENQGQFADPGVKVMQSGPLGPIDHQEAVIRPHMTDPSMKYRVINHRDETLYAIRRYQGYEPVRDAEGHEVRFMDGQLAQMPKDHYNETIGARVVANKALRRGAGLAESERFKDEARSKGFKTFGEGLKIDVGSPEQAVKE